MAAAMDFAASSRGPYLYGESECRNADCSTGQFDVLLVAGWAVSSASIQPAWVSYEAELRCPRCGAATRRTRRKPKARPRKTFPLAFYERTTREAG
jgi:hypothetical protein